MEFVSAIPSVLRALQAGGGKWFNALKDHGLKSKLADGGLELEGEAGDVWAAKQALLAMNLGFPAPKAFKLFNDNYFIEVLNLKLLVRNERAIQRYKGRVIGLHGKGKATLEELSGAWLAVSDEDVAIVGEFEELQDAKEAVVRLLEGATHASVFAFLEKRNRERRISLR